MGGKRGRLCSLYHPAASAPQPGQQALIYIHPYAQEQYAARPIATHLARNLAKAGIGVLTTDLYGMGDSDGESGEIRWETWVEDLFRCREWLMTRGCGKVHLCGVRLGGLLALDFARQSERAIANTIIIDPVFSGEEMITQLLRLRVTFSGLKAASSERQTTASLKQLLAGGQAVEVAGYDIAPEFFQSVSKLSLLGLGTSSSCEINWIHLYRGNHDPKAGAAGQMIQEWQRAGVNAHFHSVPGKPMWNHYRGAPTEYDPLLQKMKEILLPAAL